MIEDERYMAMALALARKGAGLTSPNPMVGAIVERDGKISGKGYHEGPGKPHAEVIAIRETAGKVAGSTLYTNLEPCCHTDKRTPPCTKEIIRAGIKRVVIAMEDPNPAVNGRGIQELTSAGIEVSTGILAEKARRLNESYIKYITTNRPFVILKVASSLDGKIALPSGESKWITGEKSRHYVQQLRSGIDAIMTGIGTVLKDDPTLNVRIRNRRRRQPARIVVDTTLKIPLESKIVRTAGEQDTVIVTTRQASPERIEKLKNKGIKIMVIDSGENGKIKLTSLIDMLGKSGITSLMIEGGKGLITSSLAEGIVDKLIIMYSPMIMGGEDSIDMVEGDPPPSLDKALFLEDIAVRRMGRDIVVEGRVVRGRR